MEIKKDTELMSIPACHLCGHSLVLFPESKKLRRTTSDCLPWPEGGTLARCSSCHTLQAAIDEIWRSEADEIYRHYNIYHQADGEEQNVFQNGIAVPRSQVLVERLSSRLPLPTSGKLLDIGCGNGSFLLQFQRQHPKWRLWGAEFDAKSFDRLRAIPNFESLHTGPLENLSEIFDIICLIHTLEHIENPILFLKEIRRHLRPGGQLLVQVPNHLENPFELMTADHASHFSPETLGNLLSLAGFQSDPNLNWIRKEISCVGTAVAEVKNFSSLPTADIPGQLEWLQNLISLAKNTQETNRPFGLFGSSIAAVWLNNNLDKPADFFVDEDSQRIGKSLQGKPIYGPANLPDQSVIVVPLPSDIAETIAQRWNGRQTQGVFVPPSVANRGT